MSGLVLSLFPGIGLLDMAFEQEGFCVVRGPDLLWGGDVHKFHPPAGRFDGVIGGPPCKRWSRLATFVRHNHGEEGLAPDLIPEFCRVVSEAAPAWFLMENVPGAPLPETRGYDVQDEVINNRAHAGGESHRERRFSFGWRMPMLSAGTVPLPRFALDWWHPPQAATYLPPAVASGGDPGGDRPQHRKGRAALGYKTTAYLKQAIRAQGLPPDFLEQAPFTVGGKIEVVGNGVPLPMGRAVARAVKRALGAEAF